MKKRFLAMALCLAMTLSLFPTGAFANPENEPAAPRSEAVAEIVQEQQTEALPEAAGETEESTTEAPAVPVMAEAEIAAEAEKADAEPAAEPEKADAEPEKADSEALAEPEKAESEASGEPAKADSEPVEPEAETAEEPAEENSGSKWDALKKSIGNLFGGAVEPANIVPDLKVDTYEFYVDGKIQENWTQKVAKGDELKIPGTPKKDGYVFVGWFHGKTKVESGKITKVSGTTVHVDAQFQAASYVYFVGTDGTTVVHTVQGTSGEAVSPEDISTAAEMVRLTLGSEQSVQGWSETPGDSTPLESIAFVEGTRTLHPVVKTGYWVTFNSAGGSYIAPQFSNAGKTMDLSQSQFVPTRAGYDFDGWYLNEQKVTSVDGAVTVTASWKAKDAQYTVIYWQENADDDGYSFKESETKTGTAGTKVTPSSTNTKKYSGFTLNAKKSEPKTIAGDGSTILNVYYKRNVYEVRFYKIIEHFMRPNTVGNEYANYRITAKYGADISGKWPTENGSCAWYVAPNSSTWQAHIDTMPLGDENGVTKFYGPAQNGRKITAYYYVEVLPGESGEWASDGRKYKLDHKDVANTGRSSVTKEDRYPIAGFALVEKISTRIGANYNGARFYYSRNSYDINFYSGKTFVHKESRKFEQSIADVSYEPNKPDNIPANYQFAGWYANELCEGDAFKFEGTMPANNITLYAKWAAPQITVTISKKDGTTQTITVPYGSKLEESAEWKTLAAELDPDAWMNGDKIFNLNTELYENITLTPYYKNDATPCTITYDENGTKWEDPTKYAKGGEATILNPEHSDGLKFQYWEMGDQKLLPGQSITVTGDVTLTAVYGESLNTLKLTYHNGGYTKVYENLSANSEQIAADPAQLGTGFETPKGKKFAGWVTAENGEKKYQVNEKFYITSDGKNDLYAVWENLPDIRDESVATIDSPNDVPYDGNPHQWKPTVTKAGTQETLEKDTDYTVSYSTDDFTNVTGTITVTITGIGNYTGTVERTYQITKRPVTLTSETASKPYDGTPLTRPDVTVTGDGFVTDEVTEIKATGSVTHVSEGEVTNTITYKTGEKFKDSNYAITKNEGKLSITGKSIIPTDENGMTVKPPANVKYSGSEQKEKPTVMDHAKQLAEGTDYTLGYTENTTDAGTVTVTITGIGNYTGSTSVDYQILKRSVTLTSKTDSKAYDGTPLTRPDVTVGGDKFVEGEVSDIKANGSVTTVAEGQVTNTITYTKGEKFKDSNYDITKHEGKLSIGDQSIDPDNPNYNGVTVDFPDNKTYDGTEHKWAPKVKDKEGNALTETTDYTVSYDKNDFTNVTGKITVTITGAGNYTGSVERTYEITKRSVTLTSETASKAYDGTALTKPDVTVSGDGFVAGEVSEIKATGSVTAVTEGEVTNTITYKTGEKFKDGNYTITKNEGKLSITARPISSNGITVKKLDDVLYDGGKHEQKPVVKDGKTTLTEGEHYTLHYDGDTTNAGTVTVVVFGTGNYNGETSVSYKITPRKVTLTSESGSKPYDGTPLTRPDVKVEGDGFVAGEVEEKSIRATGSVLNVGDNGKNAIEFTTTDAFKYTNYAVTKNEGTLTITGQSIVPDPDNPDSYKGITISNPENKTYDGKEHKWAPEVKDKEGKALTKDTDYTVSYDKTDFTNVTGEIKVTITGKGNYTGKVEKSYQILPATLTVTTNSAEKTHDGNQLTADGTITGFVNGETATFMITGSQTDVGSSTNTYKIEWNGTAKQSNYTVVEKLGTLKVNERSGGGGSSSTPTPEPEQTPTPTPAPVIVPPAPAPTPAPARRITPAATATPTPAPTAKPTETKQPEPEPEVIEPDDPPLAPLPTGAWALVNLILMLLTVLASLLLLLGYLGKKKHTERDEYGNERIDYTRNKKGFWRVASLIPAVAAVIAFVLTENMKLPMIMVDRWTLLMAVIAVLQLIVAVMSKKQKESQDEEDEANA